MHTSLPEILALRQTLTTPRHDLYAGIHKGVRLLLTDTLVRAGRVDAANAAALRQLAADVQALAALCRSHLAHENAHVHPVLERLQPGSSQRIAAEHVEHERDIEALRRHAAALVDCAPAERAAACRSLYLALGLFVAHNLAHMDIEETEHNAVLWAHLDDAQIAAIEGAIVASLTPDETMASMRWMLPALAPAERTELLRAMQAGAPAEAFAAVTALARDVLPPGDWPALAAALGLPLVAPTAVWCQPAFQGA